MAIEVYTGAANTKGRPGLGVAISSQGSSIFTLTTALTVVDPTDPWAVEAGTDGAHVRIVGVPNDYMYLDLFVACASASGDPTVQCYGKVPSKSPSANRRWPADALPAVFDEVDSFWVPLLDSTGTHPIALDTSAAVQYGDPAEWIVGVPSSVYLAGCTAVMVLPTSAGTVVNGVILGRFVG
jgi:hypothetical protein